MTGTKPLVQAGYFIAAMLGVTPVVDALLTMLPPHLENAGWRFTAIGNLSGVLLIPLLALFIALVCAHIAASRRARRAVAIISAALAIVVVCLIVTFAVSYFQVRATIPVQVRHVAAVATSDAIVKYLLLLLGAVGLTYAGFANTHYAVPAESGSRTGR